MNTITEQVTSKIKGSGPVVQEAVITALAQREIDRRIKATVQGLDKLDETNKAIAKIKPDQSTFDVAGKPLTEGYSKAKLDERNKLVQTAAKLEAALAKALADTPDYSALYNLIGGQGDKAGDKSTAESTT